MLELDRRTTLAWLARAGIAATVLPVAACGGGEAPALADIDAPGYGRDPKLTAPSVPWPLTLTTDQKETVTRLADLLLPADARSPAASTLGVPAFVDEWISAPYADQREDRRKILAGLDWLDAKAKKRFAQLSDGPATAILDTICDAATAHDKAAAAFFTRFRQVCMIGYYTTEAGIADLGYIGNQAMTEFPGPPPEVLKRLGV